MKLIVLDLVVLLVLSGVLSAAPPPQAKARTSSHPTFFDSIVSSRPLPNGIEVRGAEAIEQVTALRDDVLRIRIGANGQLPEDASWAVLAEPRTRSAQVTPHNEAGAAGFCTHVLCATFELKTARLRISDRQG